MKRYFKFLKFCYEINRKVVLIHIFLGVLSVFTPYLYIKVFSHILNSLSNGLNYETFDSTFFIMLFILAFLNVYMWLFATLEQNVESIFNLSIDLKLIPSQLDKISKLKSRFFYDIQLCDLISRVCSEDKNFISLTFVSIVGVVVLLLQSIVYFYFISKISFLIAIVMVLVIVPLFFLAHKFGNENYRFTKKFTYIFRKCKHFYSLFVEKEFAKEREVFNFGKNYKELWTDSDRMVRKSYLGLNFRWYGMIKLSNIFTEIVTFLIIFVVIFNFSGKALSIGFVIAFISSISRFVNSISWNVPYYIKDISEGMNYFDELNDFLCLDEETKGDIKLKSVEKIDFKSVKFRYSDGSDFILKGVSFTFEKNKHYGLVGINGAGKSTIVNLLSGVYDDFEGEILIDGKNISDIDIRSLRENILVLKQDFKKFDLSFRDNIILGLDYNEEKFNDIIKKLNLETLIKKLKNGINTNLGQFDVGSSDLSGGEWQRIAFARLLYRESAFYIFDEPISSYDFITEREFIDDINKYFKDKLCLIISHRFSLIKDCDEIYVLNEGKIVQKGNHHKLKSEIGIYKEMFDIQKGLFYE